MEGKTCGCGKVYTLKTLPNKCECGRTLFGDWARVNAKIKDAATQAKKTNDNVRRAARDAKKPPTEELPW